MSVVPSVGEVAPPFNVTDARGESLSLQKLAGKRVALIFLRHLGCPICRMELATLKRRQDELAARNTEAIVFVESTADSVREFATRNDVRFHVVADPEHAVYAAYGIERGGLGGYLAPGALGKALKATLSGHMHGRCEGSELQLPGDFLVDEQGRVSFAHKGKHIGDNTPLDVLLGS
jgi:peroxiredoxin